MLFSNYNSIVWFIIWQGVFWGNKQGYRAVALESRPFELPI
jgi:hypothetical protein